MAPILALLLAQSAGEVTFDFTSPRGLIVARATANGERPVRILVDTGARRTIVDATLAKELKLVPGEEIRAYGAGGAIDTRLAKGFRLAGLAEDLEVVELPLDGIAKEIGTPIDAILGQDVLATRVVQIDVAAGKLTFGTRPAAVFGADTVIPLRLRAGRPFLLATVVGPQGGTADAELLLDTGSDTTVELAQTYTDEMSLRTRPDPLGRSITGIGGSVSVRVVDLREIRIGGHAVPVGDVRVFLPPANAASDGDGRLGGGFLSRFKTTIDGPGGKLVLRAFRKSG